MKNIIIILSVIGLIIGVVYAFLSLIKEIITEFQNSDD